MLDFISNNNLEEVIEYQHAMTFNTEYNSMYKGIQDLAEEFADNHIFNTILKIKKKSEELNKKYSEKFKKLMEIIKVAELDIKLPSVKKIDLNGYFEEIKKKYPLYEIIADNVFKVSYYHNYTQEVYKVLTHKAKVDKKLRKEVLKYIQTQDKE